MFLGFARRTTRTSSSSSSSSLLFPSLALAGSAGSLFLDAVPSSSLSSRTLSFSSKLIGFLDMFAFFETRVVVAVFFRFQLGRSSAGNCCQTKSLLDLSRLEVVRTC